MTLIFLASLFYLGFAGAQESSLTGEPFTTEGCTRDGRCECSISGNWSLYQEYLALRLVKARVLDIQTTINTLDIQLIMQQMRNVTLRIAALERQVDHQSVSLTIRELSGLKKSAEVLVALVEQLESSGQTDPQVAALREEIESLLVVIDEMWDRNPYGDNEEVRSELDKLRQKLANCHDTAKWTAFDGDELPINYQYSDWCESHQLSDVGDPVTHRWISSNYGAWFKDPVPATDTNRSEIFLRVHSSNIGVDKFSNYSNFVANRNGMKTPKILANGIGYVGFNQSIYSAYSNNIYKRNLQRVTQQQRAIVKSNLNYLDNTLGTYVDFKVDEYGLWAIMATPENNNKLVIYQVNPNDLTFTKSFSTNKHKTSVCALFMACGKLYTLDVCTDRLRPDLHHKQYVYDTLTGQESYVRMHITSKFGHIWSLNYNPREHLIFGWDNQHLVTYPISWSSNVGNPSMETPREIPPRNTF